MINHRCMILIINLLCIHEKVDDGVDCRVSHGQPEEEEEHMLGVPLGHKLLHKKIRKELEINIVLYLSTKTSIYIAIPKTVRV